MIFNKASFQNGAAQKTRVVFSDAVRELCAAVWRGRRGQFLSAAGPRLCLLLSHCQGNINLYRELAKFNSLPIIRYFSSFPSKNPLICPACFSMVKELIHGINEVYDKIRYFGSLYPYSSLFQRISIKNPLFWRTDHWKIRYFGEFNIPLKTPLFWLTCHWKIRELVDGRIKIFELRKI